MSWTEETDIVELAPDVRAAVGHATRGPDGAETKEVRSFLNLREVCGRALLINRHLSNAEVERWDNQESAEAEVLLGQLGSHGIKGRTEDVIPALVALDDELWQLGRTAAEAPRKGDAEYCEAMRRRLDECIARATAKLEEWLGVPPGTGKRRLEWGTGARAGAGYELGELAPISDRARGADVAPRKRRASAPKPPPPTKEQKAAARAAHRMNRVVILLRRRHPDGMSADAIRKALRMGEDETRAAIKAATDADAIVPRGSFANTKHYATSGLPEKRRR